MRRSRPLAGVLVLLGAWAVVAPYGGRPLGFVVQTLARTEFATHVVPGVPLLAVAAFALVTGRFPLPAALVGVLCGFWMSGTHLPLLLQAVQGTVSWPTALWHSTPGLAVFVLTAAIATDAWLEARDRERERERERERGTAAS